MGNGTWCYPLTVMDHDSRYLLDCRRCLDRMQAVREAFEGIFREYGLPGRIRTDNGVPFASQSVRGISHLSRWWIRLGILPERIEKGKPQQNGNHERMHRTLRMRHYDLRQGRVFVSRRFLTNSGTSTTKNARTKLWTKRRQRVGIVLRSAGCQTSYLNSSTRAIIGLPLSPRMA